MTDKWKDNARDTLSEIMEETEVETRRVFISTTRGDNVYLEAFREPRHYQAINGGSGTAMRQEGGNQWVCSATLGEDSHRAIVDDPDSWMAGHGLNPVGD